eukprot:6339382-Alexandrium_andersonii.AAC.1
MARARQAGGLEEDDPCCQVPTCVARGLSPGRSSSACPRRSSSSGAVARRLGQGRAVVDLEAERAAMRELSLIHI